MFYCLLPLVLISLLLLPINVWSKLQELKQN